VLAYQARAWLLFKDWCEATGERALPASPEALARFLSEVPARRSLLVRRARAVDAMHAAAGFDPPGRGEPVRALLRPPAPPPRYDEAEVARALGSAVVGDWPAGFVGRRDAALVAMVCVGGYSRKEMGRLRVDASLVGSVPVVMERLGRAQDPGSCPACALTRWLRAHACMGAYGWRALRDELADLGERRARDEGLHDCERGIAWPGRLDAVPLFAAIDGRGGLELRLPLSARSVTAIVHARLAAAPAAPVPSRAPMAGRTGPRRSPEELAALRQAVSARLSELDALVDEADVMAEAVLGRFDQGLRGLEASC
jgi:hypothetical protein